MGAPVEGVQCSRAGTLRPHVLRLVNYHIMVVSFRVGSLTRWPGWGFCFSAETYSTRRGAKSASRTRTASPAPSLGELGRLLPDDYTQGEGGWDSFPRKFCLLKHRVYNLPLAAQPRPAHTSTRLSRRTVRGARARCLLLEDRVLGPPFRTESRALPLPAIRAHASEAASWRATDASTACFTASCTAAFSRSPPTPRTSTTTRNAPGLHLPQNLQCAGGAVAHEVSHVRAEPLNCLVDAGIPPIKVL